MTAKRRRPRRSKNVKDDAELLSLLVEKALAHIGWGSINTKDKAPQVAALPKAVEGRVKSNLGLRPPLTPDEMKAKKKARNKPK